METDGVAGAAIAVLAEAMVGVAVVIEVAEAVISVEVVEIGVVVEVAEAAAVGEDTTNQEFRFDNFCSLFFCCSKEQQRWEVFYNLNSDLAKGRSGRSRRLVGITQAVKIS